MPNLSQLSIEDLMRIEVTGVSRKEQPVADVAVAVFVITHEAIRRSGMTAVPDLLRMAPGVEVVQINSNKWAVSIRGFNGLFANKLLVLVDGRSVYNRLFSGVLWDAQDLMLDDIDRIEVIRGPGAAMWGANAVNGVINIITKTAADTQGGLVRVGGGNADRQGAVRYGGTAGAARYRLYAQWTSRAESLIAPGLNADDASESVTTGFRTDWAAGPGKFMLEGAVTAGRARALWPNFDPVTAAREPIVDDPSDTRVGHLLGNWTHTRPGGASLQIQAFTDVGMRNEPVGDYRRRAFSLDTQYHTTLGARHDLVAGASYLFRNETLAGKVGFSLIPADERSTRLTGFVQDDIALLGGRLGLALGTQVQHDSFAGVGVQPTVRAVWKGVSHQRFWAAASRALRTPSLVDRRLRVDFLPTPSDSGLPVFVTGLGNPRAETETVVDTEAGYRVEIGTSASIDVTGFVGRYDHLQTNEPGTPVVQFVPSPRVLVTSQFANYLQATTRGVEVVAQWAPVPAWHFDGSYTAFRLTPKLAAASHDPLATRVGATGPKAQWQLRSTFSPVSRVTLHAAIFHAAARQQFQVPAYTRADVSAEWRVTSRLAVMAVGQNLLDESHPEFVGNGALLLATEVRRSAGVRLRWTF